MANPKIGPRVIVDVTAHPSSVPPGIYTIDWHFDGQPSEANSTIHMPRNSGSHDMTFNLINQSGRPLSFQPLADDAIWVRRGQGQCPTGKGNGKGQMSGGAVSQGGMTLDINDDNSGKTHYLTYRLNFDPPEYFYDPDIRNGGTGTGGGTTALSITLGALAGVAATYLFIEATTSMSFVTGAVIGAVIGLFAGLALNSVRERSFE